MDVSIIIVSWNVRELLHHCLLSLEKDGRGVSYEVIVVDNNSSDSTQDMVHEQHPDVRLMAQDVNHGFAAANNGRRPPW